MASNQTVDYHAGFISALKATYDDRYDSLETIKEYVLGERPPRLDAIVLKKRDNVRLTDSVGSFFRRHNVFEFKGYGDGISINDFYKAQAYALLYMTVERTVNEVPPDTVTVTVMQTRHPRAVCSHLTERGCEIVERADGILEVRGPQTLFPYQIVNVSKLGNEWAAFKLIAPGATIDEAEAVLNEYEHAANEPLRHHLAAVARIGAQSNPSLFGSMLKEKNMDETIRTIFGDEIDKQLALEREEREKEIALEREEREREIALERDDSIVRMLGDRIPATAIAGWLNMSRDEVLEVARRRGLSL